MAKRKKLVTDIIVMMCVILLTVYWAYNYKVLSGNYNKLTVSGMEGKTILIIKDPDEIAKVIEDINESPRTFKYNTGLTYDYLPHGILTFENETEKVQIGFILPTGKTITKYWEVHTEFPFGQ